MPFDAPQCCGDHRHVIIAALPGGPGPATPFSLTLMATSTLTQILIVFFTLPQTEPSPLPSAAA